VLQPPANVPEVDARSYIVFDVATGTVLAERNADQPAAVGSLIKLLTAYVVMEAGDAERAVTVPVLELDPQESQIGLIAGEVYSRAVLLRAMLIVSANDAARTLAIDVGGSEEQFVTMMNAAASELGLQATVARNPTGLDADGQQSTARDVLVLARTLMADPTFRATVARVDAGLHGQRFPATNDLLRAYDGADGIKTGRTTGAGFCLAGAATRGGRQVFVVVLGASSDEARLASSTALLDWAFSGVDAGA
jgi:D-alanyl-D-alanine carboxypeptidase (penicillin-binding protein 5/6)